MALPSMRVTIKSNRIRAINARFPAAIDLMLRKAALDTQAMAISRVPVDTGSLKNSIQTFAEGSMPSLVTGVQVGMMYGAYVEYGTRRMGAQPYLTPAYDSVRGTLLSNMAQLEALV